MTATKYLSTSASLNGRFRSQLVASFLRVYHHIQIFMKVDLMWALVILLGLLGSILYGLGTGGNGSKKEQPKIFGTILCFIGAILLVVSYGFISLLIYYPVVWMIQGLAKGYFLKNITIFNFYILDIRPT